jgi:hypothetical protein
MAAQQRSALNAVKANERAAADPRAGKTLKFSEDRKSSPKPVTKPERESGEKRLKFFEDKKPDKDIDRDR